MKKSIILLASFLITFVLLSNNAAAISRYEKTTGTTYGNYGIGEIAEADPPGSGAEDICGNDSFVFFTNDDWLSAYSFDGTSFTLLDSWQDPGGDAGDMLAIHSTGTNESYVYLARTYYGPLRAFTFNGTALRKDDAYLGEPANSIQAIAADCNGIYSYWYYYDDEEEEPPISLVACTFDGSSLTYVDNITAEGNNPITYDMAADGQYIYLTDFLARRIYAYSFDGVTVHYQATSPALSKGSPSSDYIEAITGNASDYIFLATRTYLFAFTFNGAAFSEVGSVALDLRPSDLWSDGSMVYAYADNGIINVYNFTGSTFILLNSLSTYGDVSEPRIFANNEYFFTNDGPLAASALYEEFNVARTVTTSYEFNNASFSPEKNHTNYEVELTIPVSNASFHPITVRNNIGAVNAQRTTSSSWDAANRYYWDYTQDNNKTLKIYTTNTTSGTAVNWSITMGYDIPYPEASYNIEETTATLRGSYWHDDTATTGWWIGNTSTSEGNYEQNITYSGTPSWGVNWTKSISSLTSGEYYYVRPWCYVGVDGAGYGWNTSSLETYFITKPNEPSNLQTTVTGFDVSLSWTNASIGANTNQSVYIRYSTEDYPASRTEGTFGANESTYNNATIYDLTPDRTYYFTAWTYVQDSGSPSLDAWSDDVAYATAEIEGGIYNITIRYENESIHGNLPINLSDGCYHRLLIHYRNQTDEVCFCNGSWASDVNVDVSGNWSGELAVTVNKTVLFFEFRWNDTDYLERFPLVKPANLSSYFCRRIIVPADDDFNITFYVRTDLLLYPITTSYYNHSLIQYTYTFKDPSTLFVNAPTNDAWADIYCYNSSGTRLTIHKELFSANDEVYPMLVYDKKYFIGVGCSELEIDRIGIAPTTTNTAPDPIYIPPSVNVTYAFFDVINLDVGWMGGGSGLYVYYQDTLFGTNSVTFTVWCYSNGTLVYQTTSDQSYKNFTYPAANQSLSYTYKIEVNHTVWLTNMSVQARINAGMTPITDIVSLENLLQKILGNSPFINYDPASPNYGQSIPWTEVVVGAIAIILIASFGYANATLGMLSTGLWLAAAGTIIEGMSWQFPAVGAFLIALSIVFAIGGKEK